MIYIETERLILRQWKAEDKEPFAKLNADAEVMRYFPETLTKNESDAGVDRFYNSIEENGWGFWAVEIKSTQEFIGFVGINSPAVELPFTPCIEVGWRLAKQFWLKGYATEAAKASLDFAFHKLNLREVVSMTPTSNKPSWSVMLKIGMYDSGENFNYPGIKYDDPLLEHVLYKITSEEWLSFNDSN